MDEQDQVPVKLYIEESLESLATLEQDLLALEGSAAVPDAETINRMFRIIHTIKGGAFFFGPQALKDISHSIETLLDKVRKNEVPFSPQIATLLLRSMDTIRTSIEEMKTGVAPAKAPEEAVQALVAASSAPAQEEAAAPAPVPAPTQAQTQTQAQKSDGTVRVSVKILDALMNQAGELVLSRNALIQSTSSHNERWIENATQRINSITSELQETIMSTRMQSVGVVFNKFRRLVRDLALKLDKKAELEIYGEGVELDKTIIEALNDPLTHLVRNSLDHGIESPAERLKAGKPESGKLILRAVHKAGQVVIEISDDGGGLPVEKIKAKAISLGLYSKQQLDAMTENEICNLIFRPGFSTAEQVTEISGRGVGMDVVHSNLAKIGGTVDLESAPGRGTTIQIKLPLTLAIIPSLLVRLGNEHFAIPQVNVRSLIRVPARNIKKMIRKIGDAHVLRLRDELLPIFRLRDVLGLENLEYVDPETQEAKPDRRRNLADRRTDDPLDAVKSDHQRSGEDRRYRVESALQIVVVGVGDFFYGIIVDSLLDSAEIVVKPLGRHVHCAGIYAGATILGDGKVALILDVAGLSVKAGIQKAKSAEQHAQGELTDGEQKCTDCHSMLLIEHGPDVRLAIPLDMVARAEKISALSIEEIAGRRTLKYRGGSLPVARVEDFLPTKPSVTSDTAYIIVYRAHGREFGLLVNNILDIVTLMLDIDTVTHKQPGILGSAIIQDKITPILDLFEVARKMMPAHFEDQEASGKARAPARVLVVDDSAFFRSQIANYVQEAGYHVVSAADGRDAWDLLEKSAGEPDGPFDLILTDIEMPRMNGLELTARIRADSRFAAIPVIAITSLTGEKDRREGYLRGVDSYMAKLDRQLIVDQCRLFTEHGRSASTMVAVDRPVSGGVNP